MAVIRWSAPPDKPSADLHVVPAPPEVDDVSAHPQQRTSSSAQPAGAVYGLGLIGAMAWYWKQADGFGPHVLAVLKAVVWPAFLVHDVFKAVNDR